MRNPMEMAHQAVGEDGPITQKKADPGSLFLIALLTSGLIGGTLKSIGEGSGKMNPIGARAQAKKK